jgi:hypothetical protein
MYFPGDLSSISLTYSMGNILCVAKRGGMSVDTPLAKRLLLALKASSIWVCLKVLRWAMGLTIPG